MAMRECECGAPVTTKDGKAVCDACKARRREAARQRSGRAKRYGPAHQRARREWAEQVEAGGVRCARCAQPIDPGAKWDLGHVDGYDAIAGPEHQACNRATRTPGRATAAQPAPRLQSRPW